MNKKNFDLVLLVVILAHPAFGIVNMATKRWITQTSGPLATAGAAFQVATA